MLHVRITKIWNFLVICSWYFSPETKICFFLTFETVSRLVPGDLRVLDGPYLSNRPWMVLSPSHSFVGQQESMAIPWFLAWTVVFNVPDWSWDLTFSYLLLATKTNSSVFSLFDQRIFWFIKSFIWSMQILKNVFMIGSLVISVKLCKFMCLCIAVVAKGRWTAQQRQWGGQEKEVYSDPLLCVAFHKPWSLPSERLLVFTLCSLSHFSPNQQPRDVKVPHN